MLSNSLEKYLSRVVAVGSGLTTVFIVSGSVTDPVNVTKLLVLGTSSALAFSVILQSGLIKYINQSRIIWILSGLFLSSGLASIFLSDSPISQGIYGVYGRNNGFLTYLFLVGIFLSTLAFSRIESISRIIIWLIIAGLVNVIYCLWVISFGDFVGWSNPYGNILGTLGNPNFVGSFLGIFIAAYVGYGLGKSTRTWFKYSMLFVLPVTAFEIYDSHAIQGRIVGLSGIAIIGFFILRSKFRSIFSICYLLVISIIGFVALLGAFQIGPLSAIVYKTSVSLRGQYWLAGWNAGNSRPITGVGMDAFGDWYRRSRDAQALELPGVNTVVNAAHNVPLDMFAFGGWPLFITYLLIMCFGGVALFRTILRIRKYDPVLVVLTTSWFGYQLQSIISINQIGLAIWGWVLNGAVIAYERLSRNEIVAEDIGPKRIKSSKVDKKSESNYGKSVLISSTFGIIGLLLAIPPYSADLEWRSAQVSRSTAAIENSMRQSYFNPPNTMKYISNISIFEENNFPDLAHKYALEAIHWNPDSFEHWKLLYLIKNSTNEEKKLALQNMKRLDPLNPDVTGIE